MRIDVIIPTFHPGKEFLELLKRLESQTQNIHKIVVMNTRTGAFPEGLTEYYDNVEVYHLDRSEFDHGGTRNAGAGHTDAEYLLFMTQDAVPAQDTLVEKLCVCFESHERVAAAYGRQLPGRQSGTIERYTREFNYPPESSVKEKADLERLGIKTFFCSNVCAMYRRDVYEKLGGFVTRTIFNEDMIFAAGLIQAGYRIAYAAEAEVVHSHKYTYWQQLTRNFDLAVSQRQYRQIFEQVRSESEGMRLVKDTMKYLMKHGRWYLVPDLIMQSGFKWMGYKLGLRYESLPSGLVKKLSMNKSYWNERC